jgi:hypothetical protein
MPETDFLVISDASFKLNPTGSKTLAFTLPAGDIVGNAIIAFVAVGSGDADLTYEVQINDVRLLTHTFKSPQPEGLGVGLWEAFVAKNARLKAGANNTEFRVLSGVGNMTFQDVVVWYKRA